MAGGHAPSRRHSAIANTQSKHWPISLASAYSKNERTHGITIQYSGKQAAGSVHCVCVNQISDPVSLVPQICLVITAAKGLWSVRRQARLHVLSFALVAELVLEFTQSQYRPDPRRLYCTLKIDWEILHADASRLHPVDMVHVLVTT